MAVAPAVKLYRPPQPTPQTVSGTQYHRLAFPVSRPVATANGLYSITNTDPWAVLWLSEGGTAAIGVGPVVPPGATHVGDYVGTLSVISDMSGIPAFIADGDGPFGSGYYSAPNGAGSSAMPLWPNFPASGAMVIGFTGQPLSSWIPGQQGGWTSSDWAAYPNERQWAFGALSFGMVVRQNVYDCEASDMQTLGHASSILTIANVSTVAGSKTISVASGGFPNVGGTAGTYGQLGYIFGMAVSGDPIPAGTTVTTFSGVDGSGNVLAVSGNSITLSQAATATGTFTLYFYYGQTPALMVPWINAFRGAPYNDDPRVYAGAIEPFPNPAITVTGVSVTAGSVVLTGSFSAAITAGLIMGMTITDGNGGLLPSLGLTGTSIAPGTSVLSVTSTTIIMDQPALSTPSGGTEELAFYQFGVTTLGVVCADAGIVQPCWWLAETNESFANPANWPGGWLVSGQAHQVCACQYRYAGIRLLQSTTAGPGNVTSIPFVGATQTTKGTLLRMTVVVNSATNPNIATPSGWTIIGSVIQVTGVSGTQWIASFYKVADGTEANGANIPTVSWTTAGTAEGSFREWGGWVGTPTLDIATAGATAGGATSLPIGQPATAFHTGTTAELAECDLCWNGAVSGITAKWGGAASGTLVGPVGSTYAGAYLLPAPDLSASAGNYFAWAWTTVRNAGGIFATFRDTGNPADANLFQTNSVACSDCLVTV